MGLAYNGLGQYQQAADSYNNYSARVPGVLDGYVQAFRGDALYEAGDFTGAQNAYNAALAAPRLDDDLNLQIKIAQARAAFGDYAGALTLYDQIFATSTNDYIKAQMDYYAGNAHTELGQIAEAQTRYTSARAELDVHERELGRTAKLVEIGAASRQELERLHAEHAARIADVEGARSRLELLGVPASALEPGAGHASHASADVPAPIDGVVTERLANVGLNVDSTTKLFTVVDLTSVWVVAELYEKDFSRVRVGSPATVRRHNF
jgi:tetratricopeptide (TPR) repeat protein